MPKLDPFTQKRIARFVEDHRRQSGQLPVLQDFEKSGISREQVDAAVRDGIIEQFYVTLTNGTILKGYKIKSEV